MAAYCAIVAGLLVSDWPTLSEPQLRITLEKRLEDPLQALVVMVIKTSMRIEDATLAHTYNIRPAAFEAEGGGLLGVVDMANGHRVVLAKDTTEADALAIAEAYRLLLIHHINEERVDFLARGASVILIPMTLIGFFGWVFRWLWKKIAVIH